MVGEIVHIELPSRDFARSAAFYDKLFGWKTDGVQSGGHLPFALPGGVQGSLIRDALAQAPGPVPFIAVADVNKTLAEASKQGGRILVPRLSLPSRGVFGLFADCDGNVVGVLVAHDPAHKEPPAPESPGAAKANSPDKASPTFKAGAGGSGVVAAGAPGKARQGKPKPATKGSPASPAKKPPASAPASPARKR